METPTLGSWLVHLMRASDGALSLEEALHIIMDSMKDYFPCQSVAVILIDDDTNELRIKISRQISYTFVKKYHRNGPSPAAEKVVLEQKPLLLNDLPMEDVTYSDLKLEHDFTSAVLAPIITNKRGVGYIFCDRTNHEKFSEVDLLHLQVLGYLIGNLIEKFDLISTGRKLSQYDDATKALQYKSFVSLLGTELERARTHGYALALALISINAFRQYLDMYGIDAAHALLAEAVAVMKTCIRDMDILARFGADEFILCLSGLTAQEASGKIAGIIRSVEEKVLGRGDIPVKALAGKIFLEDKKQLNQNLQDIISALGKNLVEEKKKSADQRKQFR